MADSTVASLALADLPVGSMRTCQLQGHEILVCRTKDGIFALDNICTHALARLCEGRLRGTRVICPLHGASFDVRDGRPMGPPANRALATHQAQVIGDRVEIMLSPHERPR
jgi:3-phenylpropionate/trans-cinnamate dioxygenase ferredoxin subunit